LSGYYFGSKTNPEDPIPEEPVNNVEYIIPPPENTLITIPKEKPDKPPENKSQQTEKPITKKLPAKIVVSKNNKTKIKFDYYSINVCSLKDEKTAQNKVEILKNRNYDARLQKVHYDLTGTWFKVLIGKFKTKEEAYLKGKELEKWGIIPSFWIEGIKNK